MTIVRTSQVPIGARVRCQSTGSIWTGRLTGTNAGIYLFVRDDGVEGGGPNREWRVSGGTPVMIIQQPRDISTPPQRYGPFKPIPKALP